MLALFTLSKRLGNYENKTLALCIAIFAGCMLIVFITVAVREFVRWLPKQRVTRSSKLLHTIKFEYLPASPLQNGWFRIYGSGIPSFTTDPQIPGSLNLQVTGDKFAMDYTIPQFAKLANCLELKAKFIKEGFLFTEVEVTNSSGSHHETWLLAHVIGKDKQPKREPNNEWKFYVSPNADYMLTIPLADEVARTLGTKGLVFSELKKVRLRGNITVSPIELKSN